ncbi:MAG TPA: DUF4276 family protein [Tepidisphaeraceae bacterium]|nr:DUF4276 family protein [Tepidisphaeraceae bacterium]
MSNPTAGMFYILLVDSEGPVKSPKKPWEYLRKRDKWVRPPDATDDHVHLMIECMEAWLLSDPECLRRRFGKDYNARKLPGNPHPESISKEEIQEALAAVTSGKFHKSEHSFELLATVRPSALIAKCPSAQRFFKVLESHCGRPRAY